MTGALVACGHPSPRSTAVVVTTDARSPTAAGPDAGDATDAPAPMRWPATARRPDDHAAVDLGYLERLPDDGVTCRESVDFVPHDARAEASPLGAVDTGRLVFRRGCFSRNLFAGFLLDHDAELVACFHAATPAVAAAVTVRTYWQPPDPYEQPPRLLARTEVRHARGGPDFDVGVVEPCLDRVLGGFFAVSRPEGLPAELDFVLIYSGPPTGGAVGGLQ